MRREVRFRPGTRLLLACLLGAGWAGIASGADQQQLDQERKRLEEIANSDVRTDAERDVARRMLDASRRTGKAVSEITAYEKEREGTTLPSLLDPPPPAAGAQTQTEEERKLLEDARITKSAGDTLGTFHGIANAAGDAERDRQRQTITDKDMDRMGEVWDQSTSVGSMMGYPEPTRRATVKPATGAATTPAPAAGPATVPVAQNPADLQQQLSDLRGANASQQQYINDLRGALDREQDQDRKGKLQEDLNQAIWAQANNNSRIRGLEQQIAKGLGDEPQAVDLEALGIDASGAPQTLNTLSAGVNARSAANVQGGLVAMGGQLTVQGATTRGDVDALTADLNLDQARQQDLEERRTRTVKGASDQRAGSTAQVIGNALIGSVANAANSAVTVIGAAGAQAVNQNVFGSPCAPPVGTQPTPSAGPGVTTAGGTGAGAIPGLPPGVAEAAGTMAGLPPAVVDNAGTIINAGAGQLPQVPNIPPEVANPPKPPKPPEETAPQEETGDRLMWCPNCRQTVTIRKGEPAVCSITGVPLQPVGGR